MNARSPILSCSLVLLLLLAIGGCTQESASAAAELPGWTTSYPAALAQAQKEGKSVLLDFTGSDWCPPCILLKKRVFAAKEFQDYAAKNLVLVTVDFPQRKPISAEQLKKNTALAEKFGVGDALPTVLIVDSMGRPIGGQRGYAGTSAADYVTMLQQIIKEKPFLRQ